MADETSQPFIDPLLGTTVASYEVEERIGEGGMAVVYRARDRRSGAQIALKVFQRSWSEDPKLVRRFVREAQIASALKNAHTVVIHDFGEAEGGILYIAMELLEGMTLRELVASRGPLPAPLAAEIAAQICRSLVDAHEHGVVHRDLKPDNVYVSIGGAGALSVKVLDYGVARVVAPDASVPAYTVLTQIGTILGTPAYMAPEQARAEEVDGRTDLYSLGVMLFEMLDGKPPFFERNPLRLLEMHKTESAPAPRHAPEALAALIAGMLMKAPGERPARASDVLDTLEAWNASSPPDARTVPRGELHGGAKPRGAAPAGPETGEDVPTSPQIPRPQAPPPTRITEPAPVTISRPPPLPERAAAPVPAMPGQRPSRTGPFAAAAILALGIAASVTIALSQRAALRPRSVPGATISAPHHTSEVPAPPRRREAPLADAGAGAVPVPVAVADAGAVPVPVPVPVAVPVAVAGTDPVAVAPPAPSPLGGEGGGEGPEQVWSGAFRYPAGIMRLTQTGDRVTGVFGRPAHMGRLWGRVEAGAVELRWLRRGVEGEADEQGRGRMRRTVGDDGSVRLVVSLGSGQSVTGLESWTALPNP